MKSFSSVLAVLLAELLITSPVPAQPFPADAPISSNPILQLQVINTGATGLPVNSHTTRLLAVQVTDGSAMPVADAAVAFRLPDGGATGSFPDGSHAAVTYTDGNGRAEIPEIQWNGTAGPIAIRITAAKGTGHAGLLVNEALTEPGSRKAVLEVAAAPAHSTAPTPDFEMGAEDMARSGASSADLPSPASDPPSISITSASPAGESHSRTKWVILAAVVAAAGVGTMMALRGSSAGSGAATVPGISIGSPTISIGHP